MRTRHARPLAVLVILLAIATAPAAAQGQKGCQNLAGSLSATVIPEAGWVGQGYFSLGHREPIVTTLVDTSAGPGKELLTFTQPGAAPGDPPVGTIVMTVDWGGPMRPVPFLFKYLATGKVTGTGIYADASGTVAIEGHAIFDPIVMEGKPPRIWPFNWIAEIHGSICGVQ